jgi:hypothetical protein
VAVTKTNLVVKDWTDVGQYAVGESDLIDLSAVLGAHVCVELFADSTTANGSGTGVELQSRVGDTDEEWVTIGGEVIALIGTADSEAIANNPLGAGSTTITVASTTGYTTQAWRGIDEGGASSEIVDQYKYSNNASITIVDGTANAHNQNVLLYNLAAKVYFEVPPSVKYARVLVNNNKHGAAAGSTVCYRVTLMKVTSYTP